MTPTGRKATLSIPVNVLPPENQQPSFVGGQMIVAPGEEPSVLDLAALTTDPDPEDEGRHSYTLVGGEARGITRECRRRSARGAGLVEREEGRRDDADAADHRR